MPVVLTDHTNKTWAVEDPSDGLIHVGFTGKAGPRLLDILEFVITREKQFAKFIQKKRREEEKQNAKRLKASPGKRSNLFLSESGRNSRSAVD
jgi:hypothetical protein